MSKRTTETERADRRDAGRAVAEARRADTEARKLAKTLSRDARASLEAVAGSAHAEIREAHHELDARPLRARRMARRAAARLENASLLVAASGDAERHARAQADAKKRAKTIKRRRAQAKQAQKMVKFIALHTIVASVTTPSDEERRKKDLKRLRRRRAEHTA